MAIPTGIEFVTCFYKQLVLEPAGFVWHFMSDIAPICWSAFVPLLCLSTDEDTFSEDISKCV